MRKINKFMISLIVALTVISTPAYSYPEISKILDLDKNIEEDIG